MSFVVTKGDLYEIIKKHKLETIGEEEESNIDNVDGVSIQEKIINNESEKFITLFEKTFTEEEYIFNTENNDSVDGFMDEILNKTSIRIKDKIENSESNSVGLRLLRTILIFIQSLVKKENGEKKSSSEAETGKP